MLHPEDWTVALSELSRLEGYEAAAEVVGPMIALLSQGTAIAAQAGERLMRGRALKIWQRALKSGPAEAIDTLIGDVRLQDLGEVNSGVVFSSSDQAIGLNRPYVRLLGVTSRGWPRHSLEDPLLPVRIIPQRILQPFPLSEQDRRAFEYHSLHARTMIYSAPRRDREGRLLGSSPLIPKDVRPQLLRRTVIPAHAFSESDRLLARPAEFRSTEAAAEVVGCIKDWNSAEITAHDGRIQASHPVLLAALQRVHSATSLRKLLTDPLAFLWQYALGWKEPENLATEEPLSLDKVSFGSFIHEVLESAVDQLPGIIGSMSLEQLREAVDAASSRVATRWSQERPLPPRAIWRDCLRRAAETATNALVAPIPLTAGISTTSYTEVPFNRNNEKHKAAPWNTSVHVKLADTDLEISGFIDRLDVASDKSWARVVDYKVKKTPRSDPGLDQGKELQRCLYAFAVRQLLPEVKEIDAMLMFLEDGEASPFRLENPVDALRQLVEYVNIACAYLCDGIVAFGPEHPDYDDYLFAHPANASAFYFETKNNARNQLMEKLLPLWGNL